MTKTFGIIGEGNTDQIVIENILKGYFKSKDLIVSWLQPLPETSGNWDKVIKYLKSEDFRQAFFQVDYVVVQIDTDVLCSENVDEAHRLNPLGKNVSQITSMVKDLLISDIGFDMYDSIKFRVFFAIAVNATECWLLPLYFSNSASVANKTTGCIERLNQVIFTQHGFYIHKKELEYYRVMSNPFLKQKKLKEAAGLNESLGFFIEQLAHTS